MATKKALLDRLNRNFKPEVGDVFTQKGLSGEFLIVEVGRAMPHREVRAHLFHIDGSVIVSVGSEEVCGTSFAKSGFLLHDVGRDDFIFAGFGPTGRPHVLFKRAAGVVYRAGCRRFTSSAQALSHWGSKSLSDQAYQKSAMAKAAFDEARRRGWLKVKRDRPVKVKKKAAIKRRFGRAGAGRAGVRR